MAAAAAATSAARAEAARQSSGGCGSSGGTGGEAGIWGRGGGGRGDGIRVAEDRPNAMAYNNDYVDGRWGLFWHAGAMQLITHKASLVVVDIPASPIEPAFNSCPAFHIKGLCNMWCGKAADHFPHF